MNYFKQLLTEDFMPHGHCYLWRPDIVWLNAISDSIITLSYYAIPIVMVYLVHKTQKKIAFDWLYLSFAIFILACGTTHLIEIVNIWQSRYFLAGIIKAITAAASITTAFLFIKALPKILEKIETTDSDVNN